MSTDKRKIWSNDDQNSMARPEAVKKLIFSKAFFWSDKLEIEANLPQDPKVYFDAIEKLASTILHPDYHGRDGNSFGPTMYWSNEWTTDPNNGNPINLRAGDFECAEAYICRLLVCLTQEIGRKRHLSLYQSHLADPAEREYFISFERNTLETLIKTLELLFY